jgi:uncharacterized Tic20 family protein
MNDPYSPPSASIAPPQSGLSQEERTWAMVAHLSALTGLFTGFGAILGPLIVWLIKKDSMPYAAAEAKEALNFNISWFLWTLILTGAAVVLTFILVGLLLWPFVILLGIAWLILCIVAAVQANDGRGYRYPLTVRFIS